VTPPLAGKRVLLLGAETDLGRACAMALAEAGATLALVSATSDAEAAFAVKRFASKLGAATSQAIDATNEAAVRVMVRQVSKEMGGLDAVVDATGVPGVAPALGPLAEREMQRSGGGAFVVARDVADIVAQLAGSAS
jgi:NAD(P)-dependent dehydrogenase (short-subunit alcohol dehydrogenase family)